MAFICEVCKKPQEPRTKTTKIVTKERDITYILIQEDGRIRKTVSGKEIVEELTVCPACAVEYHREPKVVEHKRIEIQE